MKYTLFFILSMILVSGCGKSNESKNPAEIVSRDSDTVFNDIPGKHHLGENSFDMDIVDLLENVRKTHVFLELLSEEGLRDTLETEGPFTVFAISDAVLEQQDSTQTGADGDSDPGLGLTGAEVRNYILVGRYSKADLVDQQISAKDLDGNTITLGLENGNLVINNKVYNTSEEFIAENGVVYELQNIVE